MAIILEKHWKNKIESYRYINEIIIMIMGVYAPEQEKKEETGKFYKNNYRNK